MHNPRGRLFYINDCMNLHMTWINTFPTFCSPFKKWTPGVLGLKFLEVHNDTRKKAKEDLAKGIVNFIFIVDLYNDDCETLGHTMVFKTNAANFRNSCICFKYFLYFLHNRSI